MVTAPSSSAQFRRPAYHPSDLLFIRQVRLLPHPGPGPHAQPTAATTIAFDTHQELIWTGNQYGRVMSFYGPELQKYTSYKGHTSESVYQILFTDKGVLSIASHSVHFASRRGPAQWHIADHGFKDLQCMSFTSKVASEVLVAGLQDTMFKIDLEKGIIIETVPSGGHYTKMKLGLSYICAATKTGAVHFIDTNTLKVVKIWQAHNSWISDMDVKTDFIVTCGYSPRGNFGPHLDGLANVFNLKTLTPLPPIPFQAGAAFVCIHPRMSTTCVIASAQGQFQVVDIDNPNALTLIKQAQIYDNTILTKLEMAPSGRVLAFTTSLCQIHLFGSPNNIQFNEFGTSEPTIFADHLGPVPNLDWSADTPLNKIGLPYYREVLLSAWPSSIVHEVGAPPPKIDPTILSNLKRSEMGGYANNPRTTHRNQIQQTRAPDKQVQKIAAPKFLSEKAKEEARMGDEAERRLSDNMEHMKNLALDAATRKEVPPIYGNVEIKYSRFGVDDFDFKYYNKTNYSGLETHIANSYANPLLQLFRFTTLIRNLALQHTATSCVDENCLLCELGYLVDMLEKASGQNCQATNFLKTFSGQSVARSLNLLEEHASNAPLTSMIQATNRFLLDRFYSDYQKTSPLPHNKKMEHTLRTKTKATIRCLTCQVEQIRDDDVYTHELMYPSKHAGRPPQRGAPPQKFSHILKASVERQESTRGWCPPCRGYRPMTQRRSVLNSPSVLMINANVQNSESKQLWSTPNWLPQEIGVIIDRDMALSSPDPSAIDQWHLFNDFLVTPITKKEALRFDPAWKLPSVITYQLKDMSHAVDDSWTDSLDTSILHPTEPSQAEHPEGFRPLNDMDEAPRPGTPYGIDAEFVALQREEIEIKADGTRETVRPSRLGLARVSVLRGSGHDAELPFIDDYIAITEPVVDHLTQHSGISPGDLDRTTSRHALINLKVAYKKLWLLLNLGCIFVGHGLIKDFRTINIHVPKAQVVDTVELFHIAALKRKLSLRFLAWLLLKEDIQTDMHDSIEDARTALKLWRKWEEFKEAGVLEETLEWIYKRGRELGFKVPSARGMTDSDSLGIGTGTGTPGRVTPAGRSTPEPGMRSDMGMGLDGTSETPTPGRKGFGVGRMGFGSPMR
ncbi:hypothetical protein FKW77_008301 [Venturia effusa]|uniref:PAN2-PAN3 deadenylation complex catalytic subunit PAN2 n=1 Tax=Venturia effusa TaxID=50376 RepID=A0A517L9R1_9PEZI|nr:hypothetical protein FKW77_008301 [Venturia effusa]